MVISKMPHNKWHNLHSSSQSATINSAIETKPPIVLNSKYCNTDSTPQ